MERVVREALGGSDTEAELGRGSRRHYAKSRGSSAPGAGDGGGDGLKGTAAGEILCVWEQRSHRSWGIIRLEKDI